MAKKKDDLNFEDAMQRLEAIVQKLEQGAPSLDDSLQGFEEGMQLAAFCEKQLEAASGKVEKIMKDFSGQTQVIQVSEAELQDLK